MASYRQPRVSFWVCPLGVWVHWNLAPDGSSGVLPAASEHPGPAVDVFFADLLAALEHLDLEAGEFLADPLVALEHPSPVMDEFSVGLPAFSLPCVRAMRRFRPAPAGKDSLQSERPHHSVLETSSYSVFQGGDVPAWALAAQGQVPPSDDSHTRQQMTNRHHDSLEADPVVRQSSAAPAQDLQSARHRSCCPKLLHGLPSQECGR